MCLIVFARNSHPDYPLVVVANRDEFHGRATSQAHWWQEHPGVLAGQDLQAGGTWMGVSKSGHWSAVTNYREGLREENPPRSRGELPLGYLCDGQLPETYLAEVSRRGQEYAGFSMLAGDVHQLFYFSNRGGQIQAVPDGIHTLSNHVLNTPWPKAELARLKLGKVLRGVEPSVEELLAVLADHQPFDDHELPVTGIGIELERVLSPPFIVGDEYGTRSTTVLMVDRQGLCIYAERSFLPGGIPGPLALYEFQALSSGHLARS